MPTITRKDLTKGLTVIAVFRKSKTYHVTGTVLEIETNQHALPGTWVSIKVSKMDNADPYLAGMINAGHYNILVPLADIREIVTESRPKDVMKPIVKYEITLINTHSGMTWTYSRKDLYGVQELIDWAIEKNLSIKSIKGLSR